jgi:hypothetical protein
MCDPLSIAGIALGLGGTAANAIGQSQAAAASNRAYEAERARQQQLEAKAAQVQQHSNSLYNDFSGQEAARANDLSAALRGAQSTPGAKAATVEAPTTGSTGPGGGQGNITTQAEANQRSIADAYSQQQATALGGLRAFGDTMGTAARAQARDAGQIGQIGNFMKGSASVLPFELNAASHAGDTFKTLGGLASGLGKVGVAAGSSGGISSLFGGAPSAGAISLPTFAGAGTTSLAPDINAFAAASPTQPLSLGNAFSSIPSMYGAAAPNAYR